MSVIEYDPFGLEMNQVLRRSKSIYYSVAMSRSRTKIISLDKLAQDAVLGSVLVRLMMVLNDFSIANDAVGLWRSDISNKRKLRRDEAVRYFVAIQISHVFEGMLGIIKEIEDTPTLLTAVGKCDQPTQREFHDLLAYRKANDFQKIMGRIRNNLAFHYDGKLAEKALVALTKQHPNKFAPISMGRDSLDWHFTPGDIVRDRVGVREIFKVPDGANVREETDKILVDLHRISDTFGRFAGNFIWQMTSA